MKKKLLIFSSIGLLIVLSIIVFWRISQSKPQQFVCGQTNCSSGCCVEGSCITKEMSVAGYTCLGSILAGTDGNSEFLGWSSLQGRTVKSTPKEVVEAIKRMPVEELKAIVQSGQEQSPPDDTEEELSRTANSILVVSPKPIKQSEATTTSKDSSDWSEGMITQTDLGKNRKGIYYAIETCDSTGNCQKSSYDKQIGISMIWSRYKLYKKTQDLKELNRLMRDLDVHSSDVAVPAQNNTLNCRLMHELYQDNIFKAEYKEKINTICMASIYYGPEVDYFEQAYKQNNLFSEPDIVSVLAGNKLTMEPQIIPEHLQKYGIYAADLADLYLWYKDPENLEAAKYFFNLGLQYFSNYHDSSNGILALAALDLYRATNESKYLNFIDYLITEKSKYGCMTTEDCAYYTFSLNEIYKFTGNQKYKEVLGKVLSYLYQESFDAFKGSFRSLSGNNYLLIDNSILGGVLAEYNE